jgi:hypothetical protein
MSDWFAARAHPPQAPVHRQVRERQPATGSKKRHDQEQADLVSIAMTHPIL